MNKINYDSSGLWGAVASFIIAIVAYRSTGDWHVSLWVIAGGIAGSLRVTYKKGWDS